jgi:ubiquitin fusion degradation protein 1
MIRPNNQNLRLNLVVKFITNLSNGNNCDKKVKMQLLHIFLITILLAWIGIVFATHSKRYSGGKRKQRVAKSVEEKEFSESENSSIISRMLSKALRQAFFEQEVEDLNSIHKFDDHLSRRLIVMPLTDAFKPHRADLMYGKIQYGDKCSLPASIGRLIFEKRYEVPWIFEIIPVRQEASSTSSHSTSTRTTETLSSTSTAKQPIILKHLPKAYISPLDFRAPENYIFLPKWLMENLQLKANDLVDISMVRIKLAELVVFQPLSLGWDALIAKHGDPKSLLEHEINKYSALTAGSTIYIQVQGEEYPLYVKETRAEGGVGVHGVRVQDADVRTDIDRSVLDKLQINDNAEAEKKQQQSKEVVSDHQQPLQQKKKGKKGLAK